MQDQDNTTPHKAADYDHKVRQTIPFYETIHRETIDLVQTIKPAPACWLDTGCGTGYLTELALLLFPDTEFILADPSESMLQQAGERLHAKDRVRVKILPPVGSEGLSTPLATTKCQVVTAIQCHHYLPAAQRELAVRACFDALEDEGLFITFENIKPSTEMGTRIGLERWGRWQQNAGRSAPAVANHLKRFNTEYFPITVEEHLRLLRWVGFRAVELFWFSQMQAGFYCIK